MPKSKKVLAIATDARSQDLIKTCLIQEGYQVITAQKGAEGLQKAIQEGPRLALIDAALPDMPWSEVGRALRANPATAQMGIIVLAGHPQLDELVIGQETPADDVLPKPFALTELTKKLLPLLNAKSTKNAVISTGNGELDSKMGGGIPLGSLTLIEGTSGAGKSVLMQQMIWGSLRGGLSLALFTSENTVSSLVRQMRSLSLDILDYLLLGRLRVYPVEISQMGAKAPSVLVQTMRQESARDMVFVDSLTSAIAHCSDEDVLAFFEECKRLCANGTTVLVVLHSHGVNKELLIRIRSLCDAHLQLRTEEMAEKLIKSLEVTKVRGAEKKTGNIINFDVEPGWGMRLIPINKVKG